MTGPPVATTEQTLAMAEMAGQFREMVDSFIGQIDQQTPELALFAPTLATGQAIQAWMLAALLHPEWAQAHLGPLMTNENARTTADRIVARVPVEGRCDD